tara:strand:+ start:730 stop:1479 length:750 start_codon:yes stop_codon:yes gene_type:complete
MKLSIYEIEDIDLKSFRTRETLNPKVWTEDKKLKPEIRKQLLIMADDFFDTLEVGDLEIDDVTLTGSLANYNWSNYSDIDLHILVDYKDVDDNVDLVADYFRAKKGIWNENHDISVHGFDVEMYVQDTHEDHTASGVYSILNDKWRIEPKQLVDIEIDNKQVSKKANEMMTRVDSIEAKYDDELYDEVVDDVVKLKEKIRKFRKCGLEDQGEFSPENLAFKALRRNGYLEKLSNLSGDAYDKMMTIKQQ